MQRDFIGYAQSPPEFVWPGGNRLAINIVINYEEGAERNGLDGDLEPEPLSEASYPPTHGNRELVQESLYEYGSRVGIWRVLEALDSHDAPATVFACAAALERNPLVTQTLVHRAYDFVGHGYRWLTHHGLTADEERREVRLGLQRIEELTGEKVLGWFTRAPQTVDTRTVLAEEGLLFDSQALNDDIPYFQDVRGRPFLVVPYTMDVNDMRYWRGTFHTAREFAAYSIDTFDVLYRESEKHPRMMSVGLHARITGRPGRLGGVERFLEHVAGREGVWLAKRTDIAKFWASTFGPEGLWNWPEGSRSGPLVGSKEGAPSD